MKSTLEKALIAAGAVLIRNSKHKIYEFRGQRYTVGHASRSPNFCWHRKALKRLAEQQKGANCG